MERKELEEYLSEYRDSNSRERLVEILKEALIEDMEKMDVNTSQQEHRLNKIIRDLEEELHWIETEKLEEFDPEQS